MKKQWIAGILAAALLLGMVSMETLASAVGPEETSMEQSVMPEFFCGTSSCLLDQMDETPSQGKLTVRQRTPAVVPDPEIDIPAPISPGLDPTTLLPSTGPVKLLVIPVAYPDQPSYRNSFDQTVLEEQLFAPYDPKKTAAEQSVRGYYYQASYGKLDITGTIMPIYDAPENSAFYYDSDHFDVPQYNFTKLISDILTSYRAQGIDLSEYDNDKNGWLDGVVIRSLHPYRSRIVNTYLQIEGSELRMKHYILWGVTDSSFSTPEDIHNKIERGALEHEIGHRFGLLDNYNDPGTSSNNALDTALDELMRTGLAGHYINVYYKILLGWIEPLILTEEDELKSVRLCPVESLENPEDLPRAVMLIPDNVSGVTPFAEFYLAEYRCGTDFARTPGIVIWHCNTAVGRARYWTYEFYTRGYIYRFPANYLKPVYKSGGTEFDKKTDVYGKGDEFSPLTLPDSSSYGGTYTGAYLKVEDLSPAAAVLQAGFKGPFLPGPTISIEAQKYDYYLNPVDFVERAEFTVTVTAGDSLIPINNYYNVFEWFRFVHNTEKSDETVRIRTEDKELNNPITITYDFPRYKEGMVWLDIPAGIIHANAKASNAVKSKVVYADRTRPKITLLGEDPQRIQKGTIYVEQGAVVTDNLDPDIQDKLVIDASRVNTAKAGEYAVIYTVTDHTGNKAVALRSVVVEEDLAVHIHHYGFQWSGDETSHYHACACGDRRDEEAHTVVVEPGIPATCTQPGKTEKRYCSVCQKVLQEATEIPILPHSYGEEWKFNGSNHWRECTMCGAKTDLSGHSKFIKRVPAVPATCTDTGTSDWIHCEVCGKVYRAPTVIEALGHVFSGAWFHDGSGHWQKCTRCGAASETAAHTENDGVVTVKPTLDTEGTMIYSCTVCGQVTRTEILPRLEPEHTHSYGAAWIGDEMGHWQECACGEKSALVSHNLVTDPAIPATCTVEGKTEGSHCSECGYVIQSQKSVPALKHTFSDKWLSDEICHWHECTRCGAVSDEVVHIEDDGTVTVEPTMDAEGTMTYTCTVCGQVTRTESLPRLEPEHTHSYGEAWKFDATGHWHVCQCGEASDLEPHAEAETPTVPATCITEGRTGGKYCPVCGYVISAPAEIPATGHNYYGTWNSDGANHWQACSECGNKENLAPHEWDGGVETTAPTATQDGVRTYTCTVCARTRTEVIPATGGGSGGGGGSNSGGGETLYTVSVPSRLKGGTVKADPQRSARGEMVTLTVEEEFGYTLEQITARDKKGKELSLERREKNIYTFSMPASKVTVEARFVLKPTETEKPQEAGPVEPEIPAGDKSAETEMPTLPFDDVKESVWYYDAVANVYHRGLMMGGTETQFMPEAPANRGMVVTVLYRMGGEPPAKNSSFTDVPDNLYCAQAVAWAAEKKITKGCGDGTFRPDDPITREELATILYRYEKDKGQNVTARADLSEFVDEAQISEYAKEAMCWAKAEGLISGTDWGGLHPGGRATRAEIAAVMGRLFKLNKLE